MSDLLEAQTLYQNSRYSYIEAYAEYQIKKREYLNATVDTNAPNLVNTL